MDEAERMEFERQFDDTPTRIGAFELLTGEALGVYIHNGRVDVPIHAPEGAEVPEELEMFLLQLTPGEARELAGLLIYAAGRAGELADHCTGCGDVLDGGGGEHDGV